MENIIDAANKVHAKTAKEVAAWMVRNPNGGDFESLKLPFNPILKMLAGKTSWVTTSVKSGEQPYYIRIMKASLESDPTAHAIADKIKLLGKQNKIKTTTDFCEVLHRENSSLMIWNTDQVNVNDEIWNVDVKQLVQKINEKNVFFKELILDLEANYRDAIGNLNILNKFDPPNVTSPSSNTDFGHKFSNYFTDIGFKIYITILTVLDPNWTRISMLPSITPANHLHQPGGLIICEDREDLMTHEELALWQELACVPFWPWMLTTRSCVRKTSPNLLTLGDCYEAQTNDYRQIEFLFGGNTPYSLIDSALYYKGYDNEISSVIAPLVGIEKLQNYITKNLKFPAAQISNGDLPDISKLVRDDNIQSILDTVSADKTIRANAQNTNEQDHYEVNERSDDRLRKKNAFNHKPTTKISIIVPILPSPERLANFRFCLQSYDFQTAIRDFPNNFELIILLDTGGKRYGDLEGTRVLGAEILKYIKNMRNLSKIKTKIFISTETNRPIGRSSIRNYGIENSIGDVIQLFDDSILLEKEYLMEVIIRFEYLKGQKFALVGFKERLPKDSAVVSLILKLMQHGHFIPDSKYDWKRSHKADEAFSHPFQYINANSPVNYMDLTGHLCFLNGSIHLGKRDLKTFFTTAMVAFWKEELVEAGGFHQKFNTSWGMEDSHMGMVLIARGNKIIPCYSALAMDISHKKDSVKDDLIKKDEIPFNKDVIEKLKQNNMSDQSRNLFKEDVERSSMLFELIGC